jgi:hypothetical protein
MNQAKGHGERPSRKEAQFSAALAAYAIGNGNSCELHGRVCKAGGAHDLLDRREGQPAPA